MPALLISATGLEQHRLAEAVEQPVCVSVAGRRWTRGRLCGRPAVLVETGIGAVNTAHGLTRALEMETPEWVLQIGVGGAYTGVGLGIGDLAVATEEVYGDLGVVTPEGWRPADEIGVPVADLHGKALYNRFPVDATLSAEAAAILTDAGEATLVEGPFLTVQACSGTDSLGRERAARAPGAICESMEGAAAAHICALYGARFVEVRAISNLVEDRDRSRWDLETASRRAQDGALLLTERLER
jgi:futalosine hydrolase